MAVWIGLRMLWHGLVGDPNTMRPRQGSAVFRLLPGEGSFSVFILGINPHNVFNGTFFHLFYGIFINYSVIMTFFKNLVLKMHGILWNLVCGLHFFL
jgi:hypothetical protein